MSAPEDPTNPSLKQIADILGIEARDFFQPTLIAAKFKQDAELAKLWQLLRTVEGREQVIDYIRILLK